MCPLSVSTGATAVGSLRLCSLELFLVPNLVLLYVGYLHKPVLRSLGCSYGVYVLVHGLL